MFFLCKKHLIKFETKLLKNIELAVKKMNRNEHLIDPHYKHRTTLFEKSIAPEGAIVFLGDSITEMCEWQEFFPGETILNRGISGDSTFGVIDRLEGIINLQPKKIFITIGVNDLQRQYPKETVINNIKKTANILLAETKSKIYLQSILPVIEKKLQTGIKNSTIDLVNDELRKFSEEDNIEFIDNNKLMKDSSGNLNQDLSSDGLHLNGEAYRLWIENIRSKVND